MMARPETIAPALHLTLESCLSGKDNKCVSYVDKVLLELLVHLQTRVQVDPKQTQMALETAMHSEEPLCWEQIMMAAE